MNPTAITMAHTSGGILFCRHEDGGVTAMRGVPPDHEVIFSMSRGGWDLTVQVLAESGPARHPHDGLAWIDQGA